MKTTLDLNFDFYKTILNSMNKIEVKSRSCQLKCFSQITCKLKIRKKIVNNQNFNKYSSLLYWWNHLPLYHRTKKNISYLQFLLVLFDIVISVTFFWLTQGLKGSTSLVCLFSFFFYKDRYFRLQESNLDIYNLRYIYKNQKSKTMGVKPARFQIL